MNTSILTIKYQKDNITIIKVPFCPFSIHFPPLYHFKCMFSIPLHFLMAVSHMFVSLIYVSIYLCIIYLPTYLPTYFYETTVYVIFCNLCFYPSLCLQASSMLLNITVIYQWIFVSLHTNIPQHILLFYCDRYLNCVLFCFVYLFFKFTSAFINLYKGLLRIHT